MITKSRLVQHHYLLDGMVSEPQINKVFLILMFFCSEVDQLSKYFGKNKLASQS